MGSDLLTLGHNMNSSKGPALGTLFGTKEAAFDGGSASVNCDRKGSTIFNDHFYDNNTNSRTLIEYFLSSITGQTHGFIIYAMRQHMRANSLLW